MSNYLPRLGETVLYRTDGRNGLSYDLPAIITCVQKSHPGAYPDGAPNPLPELEDEWEVHLTVFSPGGFGTTITPAGETRQVDEPDDTDFVGGRRMIPGSGSYVEWNVPQARPDAKTFDIPHRTWRRH